MAGHLRMLLEGVTDDPEQHLSTLPLLTSREREQLLVEWNQTQADFPEDRCLHELFEHRSRSASDDSAVMSEGASLSYAELNCRANQVAHHLRSVGEGPDRLVGLCVERSLDTVVGLLGILKAGAGYLPLDPAYPIERLALMLEDARVSVLLTHRSLAEKFPEYRGRLVRLDTDGERIDEESTYDPPALATPQNLCYAIYTSGSAGRPKGVLLDHRGRVNNFTDFNRRFSVGRGDRLLAVSSLSFDMSAYDLVGTLAAGGSIVLPRASDERDPAHWADLMLRHRVTIWHSTPVMLQMLVDYVSDRPELWPTDLRLVLLGGDWIPVDLPDRLQALVDGVEVVSLGGATEASMDSIVYPIEETDRSWTSIPYGRPMANQVAHVLDRALRPVPIGVPGELHLGGVGLARGYLDSPELTAEKFVPNPFPRFPGDRLYRTGDLARYRPDGNLELLGRLDQQVKIRGNRVEMGEVSAALRAHPLVDQVAVVATDDRFGTKQLVAYAVPRLDGGGGDSSVLAGLDADQVTQWQEVYDETYSRESDQSDPMLNLIGWNSSYTGLPIPEEEMREWVETTVGRILALEPSRVLEIGCGTGLLLFRIAPTCAAYWGTDFSMVALEGIRRQLDSPQLTLPQVSLFHRNANDFSGLESNSFDTVILNSITQLFPSIDYLLEVLEGAVKLVKPGGRVFVGDVRSLPHLEMFHTSVRIFQSTGSLSRARLRRDIKRALTQESQLVVDPAFFRVLPERIPQIGEVRVDLRNGRHQNELTRFRYDAVLRIGERAEPREDLRVLDWRADQVSLSSLREHLSAHSPNALVVKDVPNIRLEVEVKALELVQDPEGPATVADLRDELRHVAEIAEIDPEELRTLAGDLACDIHVGWADSGELGACDVAFRRRGDGEADMGPAVVSSSRQTGRKPWSRFANRPMLAKAAETLPPRLLTFLRQRLPDYMVPSSFVILESLPLSPNGKVDRLALLPPDPARPQLAEPYVAPQGPVEEVVAGTWGDVLGFERIGRHDNFIELGGHSLLATQIVARLQDLFSMELSLGSLFSSPTVAALGAHIRDVGEAAGVDTVEVARLCIRWSQMSDEEVQAATSEAEGLSPPSR